MRCDTKGTRETELRLSFSRFRCGNLNIIDNAGGLNMGAFILGLIIGAGGALALFIYDEGEMFLRLSRQIKNTAERYRQQS
jgi:hypothetical protein